MFYSRPRIWTKSVHAKSKIFSNLVLSIPMPTPISLKAMSWAKSWTHYSRRKTSPCMFKFNLAKNESDSACPSTKPKKTWSSWSKFSIKSPISWRTISTTRPSRTLPSQNQWRESSVPNYLWILMYKSERSAHIARKISKTMTRWAPLYRTKTSRFFTKKKFGKSKSALIFQGMIRSSKP